jgi:regulatory protein
MPVFVEDPSAMDAVDVDAVDGYAPDGHAVDGYAVDADAAHGYAPDVEVAHDGYAVDAEVADVDLSDVDLSEIENHRADRNRADRNRADRTGWDSPAEVRRARERDHERGAERARLAEQEREPESAAELAARAEKISLSCLTRKGMSSWELADRLRRAELDDETVLNEVSRLERVGLLDDRELAATLVRTLQERKGLGVSGITAELRRRHVDQDAIDDALTALDGDDERARATEIAIKRAPQLHSLDRATAQRRLGAFLQRKGYSGAVVSAAVSAALEPTRGPRFE